MERQKQKPLAIEEPRVAVAVVAELPSPPDLGAAAVFCVAVAPSKRKVFESLLPNTKWISGWPPGREMGWSVVCFGLDNAQEMAAVRATLQDSLGTPIYSFYTASMLKDAIEVAETKDRDAARRLQEAAAAQHRARSLHSSLEDTKVQLMQAQGEKARLGQALSTPSNRDQEIFAAMGLMQQKVEALLKENDSLRKQLSEAKGAN